MAYRIAVFAALMLAFVVPASALETKTYDAAAVAADKAAGKPVVIHVTAPWCSTCTSQKSALKTLAGDAAYKDVVLYELDFDTGGETLRALNAQSQSTLIAYKGEKETARSAGDTSADGLAAVLKSAL
jgi:thioredoxin 1